MKTRWRPTLSDDPLWPAAGSVVMVVAKGMASPTVTMGWALGSPTISLMREPEPGSFADRNVLAPGGRAILRKTLIRNPDFEKYPDAYWAPQSIQRVTVATGEVDRAGFDPRPTKQLNTIEFGGSPDGVSGVIVEQWSDPEPDPRRDYENLPGLEQARGRNEYEQRQRAANRVTISVATFDGVPAREIATLNALPYPVGDASAVQWSPDGRLVAVSLLYGTEWNAQVHVFDSTSWDAVALFKNAYIAGSASWGPHSDRILVQGPRDQCWIQHLDGNRQPITVLAPTDSSGLRPIRPIGIADNGHLLTLRTPGNRATIMRTSIADGTHEGLLAWTDQPYMYPVIAQMPPETWA